MHLFIVVFPPPPQKKKKIVFGVCIFTIHCYRISSVYFVHLFQLASFDWRRELI